MKLSDFYVPTVGDIGYGDMNTTHSYLDTYDALLAPYKDTKACIAEIGVAYGHKTNMLHKFCENATIIGYDVKLLVTYDDPRIKLYEIDATTAYAALYASNLDIVIDDGSHNPYDQLASFKLFWPLLNKGGIYIIEDVASIESFAQLLLSDEFTAKIEFDVYDLRYIKNRYDDVLVVAHK